MHNEFIDRGLVPSKQLVEPYRLPAHIYASQVRLQTGLAAPVSAFIGRPVFEGLAYNQDLQNLTFTDPKTKQTKPLNLFEIDILKTAHYSASACTAMFANGIADAKLAIEKMTDRQSVTFMKALRANTQRNPDTQFFACAFNLFTPIVVEGTNGKPNRLVTGKMELAYLAIKIAVEAGCEKVSRSFLSCTLFRSVFAFLLMLTGCLVLFWCCVVWCWVVGVLCSGHVRWSIG